MRQSCASLARPEWSAPRGREIPCDTTCRSSPEGKPRYREGSRDKSTEQTPSPDTGRGKRSLSHEHHRDSAQRTSGIRRRANGPSVERRRFDRDSPLIVGNGAPSARNVSGFRLRRKNSNRKKPVHPQLADLKWVISLEKILAGQHWHRTVTAARPDPHRLVT